MFDQDPNSIIINDKNLTLVTHFGKVLVADASECILQFSIGKPACIVVESHAGKVGTIDYEENQWVLYKQPNQDRKPLGTSSSMTAIRLATEMVLSKAA
jgi:hypothetical protein